MSIQDLKSEIAKLEAAELKELADFIADRMSDNPAEMDETRFWSIIEQLDWENEENDEAVLAPAMAALSHFPDVPSDDFAFELCKVYNRPWQRDYLHHVVQFYKLYSSLL